MSDNRMEEREVDLIEIFWRAAEQWRGIIVVAVICALLLPLGMGVKNAARSNGPVAATSQKDDNLKYQSVLNTVSLYMQYRTLDEAYDTSVLNRADYSGATSVTSTYELVLGDASQSLVTLSSAYNGIVNNEKFTAALAEAFGKDIRARSVYDVCFFSTTTGTTNANNTSANNTSVKIFSPDKQDKTLLTVHAYLPAGMKAEAWSDTLTKALQEYSKELAGTFGPQGIKLVSMNGAPASAEKIMELQSKKISDISGTRQRYEDTYKKLPSDGKSLVDGVISSQDDKELSVYNLAAVQAELDKKWEAAQQAKAGGKGKVGISSGFTPKWMGIGFGLGLVLYLGGLFVTAVLGRKVSYAGEVEGSLGIRNFGSIYEYPYKGGMAEFLHDERIYSRRHQSTGTDKIAEDLATKLEFDEVKQVFLFTLGQGSQKVEEITRRQQEILKNRQIDCPVVKVEAPIASMHDADFAGKKKVFLQILKGETTYDMLADLMDKLEEYKIEPVGMEFIDVA